MRETLELVQRDLLRLEARGGETLDIELTPEARGHIAKPASLEDISEGSQIDMTSVEGEIEGSRTCLFTTETLALLLPAR